jgi:hypothetical protein
MDASQLGTTAGDAMGASWESSALFRTVADHVAQGSAESRNLDVGQTALVGTAIAHRRSTTGRRDGKTSLPDLVDDQRWGGGSSVHTRTMPWGGYSHKMSRAKKLSPRELSAFQAFVREGMKLYALEAADAVEHECRAPQSSVADVSPALACPCGGRIRIVAGEVVIDDSEVPTKRTIRNALYRNRTISYACAADILKLVNGCKQTSRWRKACKRTGGRDPWLDAVKWLLPVLLVKAQRAGDEAHANRMRSTPIDRFLDPKVREQLNLAAQANATTIRSRAVVTATSLGNIIRGGQVARRSFGE